MRCCVIRVCQPLFKNLFSRNIRGRLALLLISHSIHSFVFLCQTRKTNRHLTRAEIQMPVPQICLGIFILLMVLMLMRMLMCWCDGLLLLMFMVFILWVQESLCSRCGF